MNKKFPSGVLTGNAVTEMFDYSKSNKFALPAVNVVNSSIINAAMETASEINSPIIIQFSNGGAQFNAGKSLKNYNQESAIIGAILGAKHVHELAKIYGATVILHTDHCNKKNILWLDGLLNINELWLKKTGHTLFSSHMLDLSEESLKDNLMISEQYFERMSKMNMTLELELGITGGEEDGVDNSNIDIEKLYTDPSDVLETYKVLKSISKNFIIAAAFGNVHGVYKSGRVKLRPNILKDSQEYVQKKFNFTDYPIKFSFHGGSGSNIKQIQEAISYGVVKMNIDTDLQFAYTKGIRDYVINKIDYLKTQIGNPEGKDNPNKKNYDPRVWLRKGEESFKLRLKKTFQDLNNINTLL